MPYPGKYRRIERVQPGWLVYDSGKDEWAEVSMVMQGGPVVAIEFTDGTRFGGIAGQVEVRAITNAETAQRKVALARNEAQS